MGLDTRGFMDGALRGFEVMENHKSREHSLRQADERMKMEKEQHQAGLKSYDQQMKLATEQARREEAKFTRDYGAVGDDGKRTGGRLATQEERARKESESALALRNAQMAASESQQESNEYNLTQTKRKNYISENLPLIQRGWEKWSKTGEVDDILKNEYLAGSAYDPNRYLDEKINTAFDTIEAKLPEIAQRKGSLKDPEFVDALGVMYQGQIKGVVGQQDPITGKTIKDAKLGGVHLAQDINQDVPGDQPGIVLTTMVDYGDGNWVAKPITSNRSTNQKDAVKVIPLDTAMKDITSQLGMRRKASTSKAYKQLFGSKSTKATGKYQDAMINLETEKAKAIGKLDKSMLGEEGYQASINQIEAQFEQSKKAIAQEMLGAQGGNPKGNSGNPKPTTSVPEWAKGDGQKLAFARSLLNQGVDVASISASELGERWDFYQQELKKRQEEEQAGSVVNKVSRDDYLYAGDPRRTAGRNARPY